jgi:aspartyl-tRNA synthetase
LRSHYCTDLDVANIGEIVEVCGWANSHRDHGGVIFIDLRDKSGLVQLVCDPADSATAHDIASHVRDEFVLKAKGRVRARGEGLENPRLKTGKIEIIVDELIIENASETVPFVIGDNNVGEDVRLKYRYLDLRNHKSYEIFKLRSKATVAVRNSLDSQGFLEVETPILTKSTPEGARDYLVPSRVHNGEFYALPQSPQLFKQLLMCAGFDRYFQVAKCFRDEDLRADRQPEFTQIDIEMSFCDQEDVMKVTENLLKDVFKACGHEIQIPFKCMGAIYDDDILIRAFNQVVGYFNSGMKVDRIHDVPGPSMIKIPFEYLDIFNNRGYPRINPKTRELEWYVNADYYAAKIDAYKEFDSKLDNVLGFNPKENAEFGEEGE